MYSSLATISLTVYVVLLILASAFVGFRFRARVSTKAGLGVDDYVILGALIIQYPISAMSIYSVVSGGAGDSGQNLMMHPSERVTYAKILFAGCVVFATVITLVKVSTLILYMRIFVIEAFFLACYVMLAVVAGWFVTSTFVSIFHTSPVSIAWTAPGQRQGRTIDWDAFMVAIAAINSIMDIAIVTMPFFVINNLHMSRRRKFMVSGIFLLGLFCIVASAVRLYYFARIQVVAKVEPDTTDTSIVLKINLWSYIEVQMSIVAACLPTLTPFFREGRDAIARIRSARRVFSLHDPASRTKEARGKANNDNHRHFIKGSTQAWLQLDSSFSLEQKVPLQV